MRALVTRATGVIGSSSTVRLVEQARRQDGVRLTLALPIAVVVLGLTAVPQHLRTPSMSDIRSLGNLRFDPIDVVANLILFMPLGMVLARRRFRSMLFAAAATSALAEALQLLSTTRTASVIDLAVNVAGALLGWGIAHVFSWDRSTILLTRRSATIALGIAVCCGVVGLTTTPKNIELDVRSWFRRAPEANPRGSSEPGQLEGRWTFDHHSEDDVANDAVDGPTGRAAGAPGYATGVDGEALVLDGETQYVDVGDRLTFRLGGSVTLTAWIRVDRFPPDDGPIASTLDNYENGFQLDTTIDSGPRVIGFKLGGLDGRLMARYGATPLHARRWYHVAGVYDASHETMHVYLDGRLDDGCLSGSVSSGQRPSTAGVMLGRRPDPPAYRFSGMLDDVRIYSTALSDTEIAAIVAESGDRAEHPAAARSVAGGCVKAIDPRSGGLIVAIGSLIAFAAIGFVRFRGHQIVVGAMAGLAAGLVLWPAFDGPGSNAGAMSTPALAVIGGVAVAVSAHDEGRPRDPSGSSESRTRR